MELIDKSVVIAEIKKLYKEDYKFLPSDIVESVQDFKDNLLMVLDTLEVKEVDLEKALSDLDRDIKEFVTTEEFEKDSAIYGHYWAIAKYAFLLGLKVKKGE